MIVRLLPKARRALDSDKLSGDEWCRLWEELQRLKDGTVRPHCSPGKIGTHWVGDSMVGLELWWKASRELVVVKVVRAVHKD